MERVPDEIIGEILSRLFYAHEVVRASTTCKKWRRVMQFHLRAIGFDLDHFDKLCGGMEIHRVETIVTQTIMQIKRLQDFSIFRDNGNKDAEVVFSAARIRAWLMHTKDTLREMCLCVEIHPRINIFEKCQWKKLEYLALSKFCFPSVTDMESFPCLKTLMLLKPEVSALNLSNFIALCPKIESLCLMSVDLESGASLEWFIDTLKHIRVVGMVRLERFVLKADKLESLCIQCCNFQHFKLVGNEALKVLNIDGSSIYCFDLGENIEYLESVKALYSSIRGPRLYEMISKSSNLRKLQLWPVNFSDCNGFTNLMEISASFPLLTHLSLYDFEVTRLCLQGSFLLLNLVELELGFRDFQYLYDRIGVFLDKCPNLKKMIVHVLNCPREDEDEDSEEFWESLPELLSFMVKLERKYLHVEFEFGEKIGRLLNSED